MAEHPPAIDRLLSVMARLRDPATGCEWDRAQDFATIAPYTIEEAHEVADAIARGDMAELREELGDLLLQVVFHSRIAQERDLFDFDDVAAAITEKMERRHPHIFSAMPETTAPEIRSNWERLKAEERAAKSQSGALDGVALGLPGLLRAEKLQKRAAQVGFDWPDEAGAAAKFHEEIDEFSEAGSTEDRLEEAGDLLFSAVNWLRKQGIPAEEALRAANRKFERRFAAMEALAEEAGENFASLSLDRQDELWNEVKARERDNPRMRVRKP